MIAALTGRLATKSPAQLTLDVQGVGYEVFIPLSTFYSLPDLDSALSLRIYTHLREDALHLFGFLTGQEKDAFVLLIGISGIGPKLALSVLSALSVPDLVSAVQAGDVEKLGTVPGVGKKTAARIALELKEKIQRLSVVPTASPMSGGTVSPLQEDALSALVNLGYRPAEVKDVLKRITETGQAELQQVIREALKVLAKA